MFFPHIFTSHTCDAGQTGGEAAIHLKEFCKEYGYCGVAQAGPGTTDTRKQEEKKASGLSMFHLNGYVKASSATLAKI